MQKGESRRKAAILILDFSITGEKCKQGYLDMRGMSKSFWSSRNLQKEAPGVVVLARISYSR